MPEFAKYEGNCPKNVAKDAKYSVRSGERGPVVALTYSTNDDERWYMSTKSHGELVAKVNAVKTSVCGKPNGSFYINEYKQVIVPVVGSEDYYLAGHYHLPLRFDFEGKTISGEPLDLDNNPIHPGDEWVGPHAGIPYTLAAGGNDIYYEMSPRPNVTKKVMLSKQVGVQQAAMVSGKIRDIKGYSGGRFYVNEFKTIFTPLNEFGEMRYVYIGLLDLDQWFEPPGGETM